jgi:quercetin dioxygenase-like cupin family protein
MNKLNISAVSASAFALFCLIAVPAQAQTGFTRSVLQKTDFPGDQYSTLLMSVTINPNFTIARHTHPGIEIGYVVKGTGDIMIEGKPVLHLKAGQSYQIPAGVPHSAKAGRHGETIVVTYVVDKNKPLATPAP